jgi:hypothetical protein
MRFKQFLLKETPIGDYRTVGDWNKGSSFRDKRDRVMVQHPKSIENVKKKFGNNPYVFNFMFVNNAKANRHTEVGFATEQWLRENLGDEIANAVSDNVEKNPEAINVVFTNNKGAERKVMTPWIMAHRIAHALARTKGARGGFAAHPYIESSTALLQGLGNILEYYGVQDFPTHDATMIRRSWDDGRDKNRAHQLAMMNFIYEVGTFRSARERNIRDWFEVLHELFAQYVTTGNIKFKEAPEKFGTKQVFGKGGYRYLQRDVSKEDVDYELNSLAETLKYYFNELLANAQGKILVM